MSLVEPAHEPKWHARHPPSGGLKGVPTPRSVENLAPQLKRRLPGNPGVPLPSSNLALLRGILFVTPKKGSFSGLLYCHDSQPAETMFQILRSPKFRLVVRKPPNALWKLHANQKLKWFRTLYIPLSCLNQQIPPNRHTPKCEVVQDSCSCLYLFFQTNKYHLGTLQRVSQVILAAGVLASPKLLTLSGVAEPQDRDAPHSREIRGLGGVVFWRGLFGVLRGAYL